MRIAALFAALMLSGGAANAYDFPPIQQLDLKEVDPALTKDLFGAYEIRDKSGKKRCRIFLLREWAIGGMGVEVDPKCKAAFPVMDDIAGWRLMENWTIDFIDAIRRVRLRFSTPDNRYVVFGDPKDIAGIDELRKLPDTPNKKP